MPETDVQAFLSKAQQFLIHEAELAPLLTPSEGFRAKAARFWQEEKQAESDPLEGMGETFGADRPIISRTAPEGVTDVTRSEFMPSAADDRKLLTQAVTFALEDAPKWVQSAYQQSLTGLAAEMTTGEQAFDLSEYEPGVIEDIAASVLSFVMPLDFIALGVSGGAAGAVVKKVVPGLTRKLIGMGVKSEVAKKAITKAVAAAGAGVTSGTALATYEGARPALEKRYEDIPGAAIRGGALGFVLGVSGNLAAPLQKLGRNPVTGAVEQWGKQAAGQAGRLGVETAALASGSAGLEGRMPTLEDLQHSVGIVLGLKAVHGVTAPVWRAVGERLWTRSTTEGKTLEEIVVEIADNPKAWEAMVASLPKEMQAELAKVRSETYQAGTEVKLEPGKPDSEVTPAPKQSETKFKYGNSQAVIPKETEAAQGLKGARSKIPQEDQMAQGSDIGGDHVTIRYGIKGDDTAGIRKFLEGQSPFQVTLRSSKKFEPSESSDNAAVIYAPAESADLSRLNAELESHGDFTTPTHGKYKPHATIAYVKPEAADKYVGMSETEGKSFTVDRIVISKADGTEETIRLASTQPTPTNTTKPPEVATKQPLTDVPRYVQRIEEKDVSLSSVNKPHGLYTTPGEVRSPHLDLGGERVEIKVNPDAKILNITLGEGHVSGGIAALKKLLTEKEYNQFVVDTGPLMARITSPYRMSELGKILSKKYPDVDWSKYYDRQEMLEGYAGRLARDKGYDAIWAPDKMPEFSEFIGLNDNAFMPPTVKKPLKGEAGRKPVTPEKIVGLNEAENADMRRRFNLDKLPEGDVKTFVQAASEAKTRGLDKSALETADEVLKAKRPISDAEHAGMTLKAAELMKQYEASVSEISDLLQKGDIGAADVARSRAEATLNQIDKLTDATRRGRREVARAMSIGRMRVDSESMELAPVMQRARVAKGGKLTPEETAKVEALVESYSKLESRLKQMEKKYDDTRAERDRLEAEQVTAREAKKARIEAATQRRRVTIETEREGIKKRIAAIGLRVNDVTGVGVEGTYLIGRLAATYIKEGTVSLDAVVRSVRADVPDLTARNVYEALLARNPDHQRRGHQDVVRRIGQMKTQARLLLEIEQAEKGIFDRPAGKKREPSAPAIQALQKQLRDLRTQAYKSSMETSRLERAIRTINELQDQLTNQYRNIKKGQKVDAPELVTAKAKIVELRKLMHTKDELARLSEQLRTGEFEVRQRAVEENIPKELERARIELQMARKKVRASIEDLAPWTTRRRVVETVNILRTLKATADMSATLRQGIVASVGHPVIATKAFGKSFKAFFSTYTTEQIDAAIRGVDHHYLREKSGLYLSPVGEGKGRVTAREEMFMSRLAEKIPVWGAVIRASERHMVTHLNLLRSGMFDQFLAKNPNATHAELSAWANWVNVCTGRGDLGRWAAGANELSLLFFAPRFAASRIQTPYMVFKHWKEPRVRKAIARDMAAFAALGVTTLVLADLAGLEVGTDPREPDFGRIRIDDTRIDIWGGLQQPMRVVTRIGLRLTDRTGLTGKHLSDYEKKIDPLELLGRFAAYKLGPGITLPLELYKGKTIVGEPVTPLETAGSAIVPMVIEDIWEAYQLEGLPAAALSGGLNFMGVTTNTYRDRERRVRRDMKRLMAEGDYEGARNKRSEWNIRNPGNKIRRVR